MTTVRAVFLLVLLAVVAAFRGIPVASYRSTQSALRAVAEINSVEELDAAVKAAGDKLMVVDYSTTWCGPCKVVAPKYDALSEKYPGEPQNYSNYIID
jgi:thiol-disulfide isomerase/thioredoxin